MLSLRVLDMRISFLNVYYLMQVECELVFLMCITSCGLNELNLLSENCFGIVEEK